MAFARAGGQKVDDDIRIGFVNSFDWCIDLG